MKKAITITILGTLFLGSCAQNKEKREEYKDNHDKSFLVNKMGDTAVAHSENAVISKDDTINASTIDTTQSPTNYKRTKPNTEVGGHR